MNTAVQTKPAAEAEKPQADAPAKNGGSLAVFQRPRLPWHPEFESRFHDIGVTKATWSALINAIYPAAKTVDSILMVLGYCKARKLDPFKRPVHIVPVWDTEKRGYIDTVWPGIAEIRTTAVRTGLYAGTDPAVYGPDITQEFVGQIGRDQNAQTRRVKLTFPEWSQVTVHRAIKDRVVAIAGPRVYWLETYSTIGQTELPNKMWERRKRGQLEKCAEAAALRRAFPEELGNEYAAEEMEGKPFYDNAPERTIEGKAKPAQNANAMLDSLVEAAEDETEDETEIATEEYVDPITGEVTEVPVTVAAEAKPVEEVKPEPPKTETKKAAAKPKDEPKPQEVADKWSAYLDKMQVDFFATTTKAVEAAITGTFIDTVSAAVERNEITIERGKALQAEWMERGAKKK
jgi:phage recombination protein Bet